jgi:hypothetical protein
VLRTDRHRDGCVTCVSCVVTLCITAAIVWCAGIATHHGGCPLHQTEHAAALAAAVEREQSSGRAALEAAVAAANAASAEEKAKALADAKAAADAALASVVEETTTRVREENRAAIVAAQAEADRCVQGVRLQWCALPTAVVLVQAYRC